MKQQLPLRFRLEGHTNLDDYVGDAAGKLQALAQLIYLTGVPGSGKSHLLQGLCHSALEKGETALYLPLSLDAEGANPEPSVLEGLESVDLVCLDDVDAVLHQSAWQIAIFHLINACKDLGTKLVLSAETPVVSLGVELEDLSSRLKAAYLISTDDLADGDKLEVIRLKARRRGFTMGEEVCNFILARSQRDMRHLAQLVDQLDEETLRQQKKVTIPFVKSALGL